jgi:hypothetical protein
MKKSSKFSNPVNPDSDYEETQDEAQKKSCHP